MTLLSPRPLWFAGPAVLLAATVGCASPSGSPMTLKEAVSPVSSAFRSGPPAGPPWSVSDKGRDIERNLGFHD